MYAGKRGLLGIGMKDNTSQTRRIEQIQTKFGQFILSRSR